MTQLDGQRVLVIGTGAMGRATARLAVELGGDVILAGRDPARLVSAGEQLRVGTAVGDAEVPEQAMSLLRAGPVYDHVAVLAGSSGARASSVVETPVEQAQAAYGRLWAAYNVLQAAASALPPHGSVTLLSGSSSRRPVAGLAVWGALHGAIEALARNAVLELSPIRVNTVSPGGIGIGMDRQLNRHQGTGEDIAAAVLALMTNPAITGAVLDVDGGERLGRFSTPG